MAGSLEVRDVAPRVRSLIIHHPERRNALDASILDGLERALRDDVGVGVWIVEAAGEGVFSSGYDLTALQAYPDGTPLPDERLGEVFDLISQHPRPSIAVLRGAAVGAGCELAAACDFRIGSSVARFLMPPAKVGVVYALKGLRRLASRAGEQTVRRMVLTGRAVESEEAFRVGLFDAVVEDPRQEALTWAAELASHAPLAIAGMKRGLDLLHHATPEALAHYEQLRRESFNSADAKEGRDALLARRPPRFIGS